MRKARLNKPNALVGPKRLARLLAEAQARKDLMLRIRQAQGRARKIRRKKAQGEKLLYVPGTQATIRTPYGAQLIRRRRAANKIARASRKANRRT